MEILSSSVVMKMLEIPSECAEQIQSKYPLVYASVCPRGYNGGMVERDEPALAASTALQAHADVDADVVYAALEAIYDHFDEFSRLYATLTEMSIERAVSAHSIVPHHAGAVRFLKDRGVWTEEEHGLIEEALKHALMGGDAAATARLVAQNGDEAMNQEQWGRLDRWLTMVPVDILESDPRLLLLKAWLCDYHYQFTEGWRLVDQAETLLSEMPQDAAVELRLRGEMEALRSKRHYFAAEAERAVTSAKQAVADIPLQSQSTRGYAMVLLAASLQMAGDLDRAYSVLYEALEDRSIPRGTFQGRCSSR